MHSLPKMLESDDVTAPSTTGTTVIALCYEGGVAMLTDRQASRGSTRRYKGSRQFQINKHCVVGFEGGTADMQTVLNLLEVCIFHDQRSK